MIIQAILHYRYIIIVPIALFEGPLIMMIGGFLLKLGYFNFWPLYLCLMLGDFIGDILWYFFGYHYGHKFIARFGKYFGITENAVNTIQNLFHRYKNHILVINKLTMGFGFATVTLFTAGLSRIPFKRYLLLNGIGQFFWTGFLMAIGFYLGTGYVMVNNALEKASFIAIIIVVFIALLGFGRYVKSRVVEKYTS
jgi:membrane-associated protein